MFEGNAATVIGKRVGNYVVERTLAQGGMGSVFVAKHPALGRTAAVKFLGQDFEAPPELTQRFLDEARITANLRHPNIIDIFDFGELDGRLYYVMELLDGRDLSAVMRIRRRFTCEEVIDFMEQICSGLAAAHAVGVVHRDLKPGNIFVVRGEPTRLKLMDFGVAKIMTTKGEQTRYGQIIGTPRYMSPEQALGQIDRITPQSDLYALGVIAYEMLTGVAPFDHESPVMLLVMHVRDPVRSIDEHVADVPKPLTDLINACLAKDPKDRPASAQQILEHVAAWKQAELWSEQQRSSPGFSSRAVFEALSVRDEPIPSVVTSERFVDADTVLGTPAAPGPNFVVDRALEVLSQRDPAGVRSESEPTTQPNALKIPERVAPATPPVATFDKTLGPTTDEAPRAPTAIGGEPTAESPQESPRAPTAIGGKPTAKSPQESPRAPTATRAEPTAKSTDATPRPRAEQPAKRDEVTDKDRGSAKLQARGVKDKSPEATEKDRGSAKLPARGAKDRSPDERISTKLATRDSADRHPDNAPGTSKLLARDATSGNRAWANVQLDLNNLAEAENHAASVPATVNLTESDRTTLNRLLSRMQRRGDFPAFVQNVGEVSKRADFEGSYSAGQLGSSILKDYALTAKLLRIVNSTYASRFGGKIYSIQHAIVILGFDRIRSLALSTSLFKNQGNKDHAERISESAITSLVSGEIARQLYNDADLEDPEQAMVCSMFRNLGKHLVLVYLPEQYDQIAARMREDNISLNNAAERVLGISLHKIGIGIAERWRLPPKMISAMSAIPERTGKLRREEDKLASLAEFSNELCEIVAEQSAVDVRSAALKSLLQRHRNLVQIESDDLAELLQSTQQSFEQRYASLLGAAAKTNRFARSVATLSGEGSGQLDAVAAQAVAAQLVAEEDLASQNTMPGQAPGKPMQISLTEPTPAAVPLLTHGSTTVRKERPKQQVARIQLAKTIEADSTNRPEAEQGDAARKDTIDVAVATAIAEYGRSGTSEQLFTSLLTAVARYLDVPRILALRATTNRRELAIVGGVGEDIEGLSKELRFPLAAARAATDPFSIAYHSNRDFAFEDVFSAKATATLPQRYYEAIGSSKLLILACCAKGPPTLVLSIDLEPPRELPGADRIAALTNARQALTKIAPVI